ncbi:MAG: acetolactate synthase large subunit [Nannocystaceae bacterium]|nr:acetolactate synthase large subunit [bacterium]
MPSNTASVVVSALEAEGVDRIFGVPGEENLAFLEALRSSPIEVVLTRHEQHAAFLAANLGRLTGTPGVCFSTLGPGATNLATGLAYAQTGRMPLVAITGQKKLRGNDEGEFQQVRVVESMRPLVHRAETIIDGADALHLVRRAFRDASQGAACLLELPQDVALEPRDAMDVPAPCKPTLGPAPREAVGAAADLLSSAELPLLLLGAGANNARVGQAASSLCAATGLFAITTQMGKGALSASDEPHLATIGVHTKDYVHAALERADVVMTVGYDVSEHPPEEWNVGRSKALIHLDRRQARVHRGYLPSVELLGDVPATLEALRRAIKPRTPDAQLAALRGQIPQWLAAEAEAEGPAGPGRIVRAVRRGVRAEDVVALDNGLYKIFFARAFPAMGPQRLLLDNALATMGAGLATAMAAAQVEPNRFVVAVCGDGGLMMNVQELETLARTGASVCVVVLVDDAFGFIQWEQRDRELGEYSLTFDNPDFVRLAEAFGIHGVAVEDAAGLEAALREAKHRGGPSLIRCPIEYPESAPFESALHEIAEREIFASK